MGLIYQKNFLQIDPEKIITIREALNHPYIVKLKEEGYNNDSNE